MLEESIGRKSPYTPLFKQSKSYEKLNNICTSDQKSLVKLIYIFVCI